MTSRLPGAPNFAKKLPLAARSMLFIPATANRFIDKAHTRGADVVILDIEDSVALSEKDAARKLIPTALERMAHNGVRRIFVRINSNMRLAVRDLEAVVSPVVEGIFLPKVQSAEHVKIVSELIGELEMERGMAAGATQLAPRIESAAAFIKMDDIAAADPRVTSFGIGAEDFSLSLGVEPTSETLMYPKQRMLIAARAAGVTPMGLIGSGASYNDPVGMAALVRRSRQFGFEGATCIHPATVPILNQGFAPTLEEVERAERLLQAYNEALAAGIGAIGFEGQMVDYPVAFRAERLVTRHRTLMGEAGHEARPPGPAAP